MECLARSGVRAGGSGRFYRCETLRDRLGSGTAPSASTPDRRWVPEGPVSTRAPSALTEARHGHFTPDSEMS
ncbi:MAG: hypothetical protein CMJ23_08355 [Phycisphaerae bacterium]|nr:hypothetical protein [Phycisphaerae bacterium]